MEQEQRRRGGGRRVDPAQMHLPLGDADESAFDERIAHEAPTATGASSPR